MYIHVLSISQKPSLYTNHTDWDAFRETLEERLNLAIPLQTPLDIEDAVETLTFAIQQAACQATPPSRERRNLYDCPATVKRKLQEKRKARKSWQITSAPEEKLHYNKLTRELKLILHGLRNNGVKRYLANLTPTPDTSYSLWKATRKMKHPPQHIWPLQLRDNTWARTDKQKATAFAKHLTTVFRPFPITINCFGRRNHSAQTTRSTPDGIRTQENPLSRGSTDYPPPNTPH
jgi:hypothetical protein